MSDGDDFKVFEVAGWNDRAATYGSLIGTLTARLAEPLLDAAIVEHDDRILDLATGTGHVAERAAARGARVTGVDLAKGMLAIARERLPEVEFLEADVEQLPFDDDSFAAVVGGFILFHVPSPDRAVAEAARVLSPGGRTAFSIWDTMERMRVLGTISDATHEVELTVERTEVLPGGPNTSRFDDEDEFAAVFERAGLDEVEVETIAFTHHAAGADELWTGFMHSSVRSRALIDAQPQQVRDEIRAVFERNLEPHATGAGYEVPVSAKIGSARKP